VSLGSLVELVALVETWAAKYEVESALERRIGPGPSACDALATRGVRVTTWRDDEGSPELRADLVVIHGGAPEARAWREWLAEASKRASKLVIVAAPDPARSRHARLRRIANVVLGRADETPAWGTTSALAPVLWEIGRVREHARLQGEAHAFVVDVRPRTPQARRKLRLAGTTG
jgi:predicted dienelactone hydrolase